MKNNQLHKQERIFIYSVETSAFYTDQEKESHQKLINYETEHADEIQQAENAIESLKDEIKYLNQLLKDMKGLKGSEYTVRRKSINETLKVLREQKKELEKVSYNYQKKMFKQLLSKNPTQRTLDQSHFRESNVIAIFESTLTRTLKMENADSLNVNPHIIIVDVYYFEVLKSLIHNGFRLADGEQYVYMTSSAGQIRNKKCVMIRKKDWEKHEKTLMCGLTYEKINKKGGINTNKLLAYLALNCSSTNVWKDFPIDRTIVVNDFEIELKNRLVDYIDDEYNVHTAVSKDVPINVMDGCGIMSLSVCKTNRMVRAPWVKGLLTPVDWHKWLNQEIEKAVKSGMPREEAEKIAIVQDVKGNSVNVLEKDEKGIYKVLVILTKSQWKLHKYYDSWDQYVEYFKDYNCQVGYCNEEGDFGDKSLSYQPLQTLVDMSDDELKIVATETNNNIKLMTSDRDVMLKVLGATKDDDQKKNYFQKALAIYPEMLNDKYTRKILADTRESMIKNAKAGKLRLKGSKYTFIIPDVVGFMQWLFLKEDNPVGELNDGKVFCKLFEDGNKVDIIRAPHLYKEHQIKTNKSDKGKRTKHKWFTTNAIYISVRDLISKVLQADFDGDKVLVISNPDLVSIAERNMEGILPLYYEMHKAHDTEFSPDNVYTSLTKAFNINIGDCSNQITRVLNKPVDEDSWIVTKQLVKYNNELIDYAKTLHRTKIKKDKRELINEKTNGRMPHFFQYAKNYDLEKVEPYNKSVVNRLENIIVDDEPVFVDVLGTFDYLNLMHNQRTSINSKEAKAIIDKYNEINRKKFFLMQKEKENKNTEKILKHEYTYAKIKEKLLAVVPNKDENYVTDVLLKHLYSKNKESKETLWKCFGETIYSNIIKRLDGTKQCVDCGDRMENAKVNQKFCSGCANERKKLKQA